MGRCRLCLPVVLDREMRGSRFYQTAFYMPVVLSLALIAVLIPLALFGVLGLAAVVLVHELAEVGVIANGVRAGRTRHLATLSASPDSAVRMDRAAA